MELLVGKKIIIAAIAGLDGKVGVIQEIIPDTVMFSNQNIFRVAIDDGKTFIMLRADEMKDIPIDWEVEAKRLKEIFERLDRIHQPHTDKTPFGLLDSPHSLFEHIREAIDGALNNKREDFDVFRSWLINHPGTGTRMEFFGSMNQIMDQWFEGHNIPQLFGELPEKAYVRVKEYMDWKKIK